MKVTIDSSKKFQEIEGLGFFGARCCWWNSDKPEYFYDDAWLEQTLVDLGITMWRNEVYPNNPVDSEISIEPQSAHWGKQKDAVVALVNKAKELGEPLKIILSIWSPPGEWKVDCSDIWQRHDTGDLSRTKPHPSTKKGGTLNPKHYTDYGNWLVSTLDMYHDAGIPVYALSMQNEAMFPEPYNSCAYTHDWYKELLINVVPIIRKKYPDVLIFGSENMLSFEAELVHRNFRFHEAIVNDKQALENIDVFAVHGYTDGIRAEAVKNHRRMWELNWQRYGETSGKKQWMTETSGFYENWVTIPDKPGSLDLAVAIHSALAYGNVSAWVWWQGGEASSPKLSQYILTASGKPGKRYYASKHFYRYIRPGAKRVDVTTENGSLLVSAYVHEENRQHTVVLVNTSEEAMTINLDASGFPEKYQYFITTESDEDNCRPVGTVESTDINIPALSVVTLFSENMN